MGGRLSVVMVGLFFATGCGAVNNGSIATSQILPGSWLVTSTAMSVPMGEMYIAFDEVGAITGTAASDTIAVEGSWALVDDNVLELNLSFYSPIVSYHSPGSNPPVDYTYVIELDRVSPDLISGQDAVAEQWQFSK